MKDHTTRVDGELQYEGPHFLSGWRTGTEVPCYLSGCRTDYEVSCYLSGLRTDIMNDHVTQVDEELTL